MICYTAVQTNVYQHKSSRPTLAAQILEACNSAAQALLTTLYMKPGLSKDAMLQPVCQVSGGHGQYAQISRSVHYHYIVFVRSTKWDECQTHSASRDVYYQLAVLLSQCVGECGTLNNAKQRSNCSILLCDNYDVAA